ncbi:MAG: hypothetical protein SF069_02895 [Phycisphaerae bacterium]|nr:hypothetical protein [Phycisphaerae bacterium]
MSFLPVRFAAVLALATFVATLIIPSSAAQLAVDDSKPRYELTLSADEFVLLHAAAQSGVQKYGGDADFRIMIFRSGEDSRYRITIDQKLLLDVWTYWMAEKTADVVGRADFDQLSEAARTVLTIAQRVNAALASAKANPVWETAAFEGRLVADAEGLVLAREPQALRLDVGPLDNLYPFIGGEVIVFGSERVRGRIAAQRVIEHRKNALEIIVMSQCPFAKRAEAAVLEHLRSQSEAGNTNAAPGAIPSDTPFDLSVRYLFTAIQSGGKRTYGSLHGEPEIRENLVQMIVRDEYSHAFRDYLSLRIKSDEPWQTLAKEVGLSADDLSYIEDRITRDRDAIIAAEYAFVQSRFGAVAGSPTFFWESRPIQELADVPHLRGVASVAGQCGGADSAGHH